MRSGLMLRVDSSGRLMTLPLICVVVVLFASSCVHHAAARPGDSVLGIKTLDEEEDSEVWRRISSQAFNATNRLVARSNHPIYWGAEYLKHGNGMERLSNSVQYGMFGWEEPRDEDPDVRQVLLSGNPLATAYHGWPFCSLSGDEVDDLLDNIETALRSGIKDARFAGVNEVYTGKALGIAEISLVIEEASDIESNLVWVARILLVQCPVRTEAGGSNDDVSTRIVILPQFRNDQVLVLPAESSRVIMDAHGKFMRAWVTSAD